jgi:hypothetical protein
MKMLGCYLNTLGLKPYKANGFTAQILVSMPDPETGDLLSIR